MADITQKWVQTLPMKWSNCQPIMHDVNNDGIMEIFLADRIDESGTSRIMCLNGSDGSTIWNKYPTPSPFYNHRPLELAKVDGVWMLFVAGPYGSFALDANTGATIWRHSPSIQGPYGTARGMEAYHLLLEIDGVWYFYVSQNIGGSTTNPDWPINPRLWKINAKTGVVENDVLMHYSCHGGISGLQLLCFRVNS